VRHIYLCRSTWGNMKNLLFAATFFGILGLPALSQDPPSRVARLNHAEGAVSMQPAGADDWVPAEINHPFTIGDYLYTDQGARAELHLDVAAMRLGSQTSFGFLNLSDQVVQIKLTEGDMYFRLHDLPPNTAFEVDTPNAAITLLGNGVYRFRVDPNGGMSFVVVRQGQAQISGGGQAITLNAGNSAMLTGAEQLAYDVKAAPAPDDFDNWCGQRDAHEAHLASARYLPPTVIGYEDLDDHGAWQEAGDYGPVWYPHTVPAGWAPYHSGHWVWVDPWGWTWVDDAPWGFAPFHYGRWAYIGGRWGWCPGPIAVGYRGPAVRPYYAPALVAWFGGAHWGVSVSTGGPSLGWVPLGYGEVFTPPYVCSRGYFNNVNVYNTRIARTVNITNVYNTVYVNHTVYNREYINMRTPGAVMAMRQDAFAGGRPVREGGFAVRQADYRRVQEAGVVAPPIAPGRQSFAGGFGRPVARPAAQVIQRQVIARSTPPPAPARFAERQQYLQQHAGQLHNYAAMHQAVAPHAAAAAFVRQTPEARPVQVRAGERGGGHQAFRAPAAPEQQQPRPAVQGTPPNARPNQNSQPADHNQHLTERVPESHGRRAEPPQPQAQPAPVQAPRIVERSQPQPSGPARERQQAPRPQPRFAERPPPAPAQPRVQERNQPRYESRPVPQEPRPAPAARPESRPSPQPQEHRAPGPPQGEHKDHGDHKDHGNDRGRNR
jgi:hypothetical protein